MEEEGEKVEVEEEGEREERGEEGNWDKPSPLSPSSIPLVPSTDKMNIMPVGTGEIFQVFPWNISNISIVFLVVV